MGITAIISAIAAFFSSSKAGESIGGTVANVTALAATLAALAPVALWLVGNKDAVFVTITYGELAFWLGIFGGFVLAVVKVAHWTRPPSA